MRVTNIDDLGGTVATLEDVLRDSSVVLLGEPGSGKTTALEAVLKTFGAEPPVDGAALSEIGIERELLDRLRALPPKDAPDPPPVLIAIDQIDESPTVARLGGEIRRALAGRNTTGLRIVLACRTADLPPDLVNAVSEATGSTLIADLTPLSRSEAVELASSVVGEDARPLDGRAIVQGAVNAGAGALAAAPLTLGLLVRQFRRDGQIKGSAAELFADAMDLLLDEPDPDRGFVGHLLIPERLIVAKTVAVRLVLAGKRSIWIGTSGGEGEHDLSKHHTVDPATGGSNEALTEVLATALFAGRGDHRLGFAHGSYAAYLAARYLADHDPPEAQLRSMFLVPTGPDRFAIPTPLRETAAWLVTLQPQHASWLIDADVGSLVPHRSVLDSPPIRSLLVEAALRRADELELDGTWEYRERSFLHPGLGEQISAVLARMSTSDPTSWPTIATARLALQIVAGEAIPELVLPLLEIVVDDRWPAYIRSMAVWIAYDSDASIATPVLLDLLNNLDTAGGDDPLDDLRASLVDTLWPDPLTSLEALTHVVRPEIRAAVRSLDRLRREFTERVPDPEFRAVLDAVADLVDRPVDPGDTDEDLDAEESIGAVPADLVHSMVDRALADPDRFDLVPVVARLCRGSLAADRHPPLPTPLAALDENGDEDAETVRLRRALALALVWPPSVGAAPAQAIQPWIVADTWGRIRAHQFRLDDALAPGFSTRTSLVDGDDFAWAYALAGDAQDPGERAALTDFASQLLSYVRPDHVEVLVSDRTNPVFHGMRYLFEPMALDCEIAVRYRKQRERRVAREPQAFTAEQASTFSLRTHELLTDALTDGERFVDLIDALQFDPVTGIGHYWLSEPLTEFPGTAALDRLGDVTAAAANFVNTSDDQRAEWLAGNTVTRRVWAANVALAHLHHERRLNDIRPDAWPNWHGVIVEFRDHNRESREIADEMFDRAYEADPEGLAVTVAQYIRRSVNTGNWAHQIEHLDLTGRGLLADKVLGLLHELTEALGRVGDPLDGDQAGDPGHDRDDQPMWISCHPDSIARGAQLWRSLFPRVEQVRDAECRALCRTLISHGAPGHRRLKALAALGLLVTDPVNGLPLVRALGRTDPDLARQAAGWFSRNGHLAEQRLDEGGAADMYRWLADVFPPADDQIRAGASWVGDDDEGRRWRDHVLTRLADRGSDAALQELERLSAQDPTRLGVKAAVTRARRQIAERVWSPIDPSTVDVMLTDPRRRIVDRDDQLAELIGQVLAEMQTDMTQVSELLWDRATTARRVYVSDPWVPKNEAALGAFLTRELRARLPDQMINREVLVEPTNASGGYSRVDLKVEVRPKRQAAAHLPTVMVELKGAWHADVRTAQRKQLLERYLLPTGIRAGVYVVAWFPPDQWADGDSRRQQGARFSVDGLQQFLTEQADGLEGDHAVRVVPVVLDMRRPSARNA